MDLWGELGLYWIRSRFIKNSYFAPNYTKIKNVLAFTSDNNFTLYEGFFFRKSVQYTIFARFGKEEGGGSSRMIHCHYVHCQVIDCANIDLQTLHSILLNFHLKNCAGSYFYFFYFIIRLNDCAS